MDTKCRKQLLECRRQPDAFCYMNKWQLRKLPCMWDRLSGHSLASMLLCRP